jgi:hypothetical protein
MRGIAEQQGAPIEPFVDGLAVAEHPELPVAAMVDDLAWTTTWNSLRARPSAVASPPIPSPATMIGACFVPIVNGASAPASPT